MIRKGWRILRANCSAWMNGAYNLARWLVQNDPAAQDMAHEADAAQRK
jgi:hypothetical protein